MDRLDTDLRTAKSAHGVRGEIKWGKISAANFDCYQEFADVLFRHIGAGSIKYRQMFLDRSYVWQPRHGEPPGSDLTSQGCAAVFRQSRQADRYAAGLNDVGAAGSYGNQMHKKRKVGQRGMSPKQKVRDRLCRHIYNSLRQIDAADRGAKAFSWFETTGKDGEMQNLFHHNFRNWKFVPARHVRDDGWQNRNLDGQGNYVEPSLRAT